MGDLGPKWAPRNLTFWALNLNYRSVPRNYVSYRRVISIEKTNWTPFPFWAWVWDQLIRFHRYHFFSKMKEIDLKTSIISENKAGCSFVIHFTKRWQKLTLHFTCECSRRSDAISGKIFSSILYKRNWLLCL